MVFGVHFFMVAPEVNFIQQYEKHTLLNAPNGTHIEHDASAQYTYK